MENVKLEYGHVKYIKNACVKLVGIPWKELTVEQCLAWIKANRAAYLDSQGVYWTMVRGEPYNPAEDPALAILDGTFQTTVVQKPVVKKARKTRSDKGKRRKTEAQALDAKELIRVLKAAGLNIK